MENHHNDITHKIKHSCDHVANNSLHIKINLDKIHEFIESHYELFSKIPTWSSCHFDVNQYGLELTIAYICIIDALNFCFWPVEKTIKGEFEYGDLVNNLNILLLKNTEFFTCDHLVKIHKKDVRSQLFSDIEFPLLDERTRSLNELGWFIKTKYDSSFLKFIENNDYDCIKVSYILLL
jgi:hypothetical protein